jgi:hypothetical protein
MEKSSQIAWKFVPLRHFFPLEVVPLIEIILYKSLATSIKSRLVQHVGLLLCDPSILQYSCFSCSLNPKPCSLRRIPTAKDPLGMRLISRLRGVPHGRMARQSASRARALRHQSAGNKGTWTVSSLRQGTAPASETADVAATQNLFSLRIATQECTSVGSFIPAVFLVVNPYALRQDGCWTPFGL